MSQPLVLAIEPDQRQAAILKRIVREKALADVAVVDSRDAAIEAIRTAMPDVLLLSALLSPRDEDELFAHLKTLDNAGHLQTHTIPQLASTLGPGEGRSGRGFLSAFRRKKDPEPAVAGCDPDLFAEEIRVFLQHAADKKREIAESPTAAHQFRGGTSEKKPVVHQAETASSGYDAGGSSSWESPFEWKPTTARTQPPRAEARSTAQSNEAAAPLEEPSAADALFAMPLDNLEPAVAIEEPLPAAEPLIVAESAVHEPAAESVLVAEPAAETLLIEPAPAQTHSDKPLEPLIYSPPQEPIVVHAAAAQVIAAAAVDPWVVHTPRAVTIEPIVVDAPRAPHAYEPLIEVIDDTPAPEPLVAREHQPISIELDALTLEADPEPEPEPVRAAAPPSPIHDRAVAIVARLQEEKPQIAAAEEPVSEWAVDAAAAAARSGERLGPLSRWARSEPVRKPKSAAVTADDVRALIASLAVPTSVASITYPKGCRIRRVRVPPAPDVDAADSVGAVILSRRKLAQQRDKHTTA